MNIAEYLERKRIDVDRFLDLVAPPSITPPTALHESMRYSLLAGGKRIRPILTIAAAEAIATTAPGLMPVACSLEFIHTYSLIHDDLPSMDNDDFRRGKPTNHKVYGEAMAILAGDALLTMAFEIISRPDLMKGCDPVRQVRLLQELAYGSGNMGMVGGQVFDIQAENKNIDLPTLQNIHKHARRAWEEPKYRCRTGQENLSDLPWRGRGEEVGRRLCDPRHQPALIIWPFRRPVARDSAVYHGAKKLVLSAEL
jgi:geranylgeranyl diphosphate synthase type II